MSYHIDILLPTPEGSKAFFAGRGRPRDVVGWSFAAIRLARYLRRKSHWPRDQSTSPRVISWSPATSPGEAFASFRASQASSRRSVGWSNPPASEQDRPRPVRLSTLPGAGKRHHADARGRRGGLGNSGRGTSRALPIRLRPGRRCGEVQRKAASKRCMRAA